MATYAGVSYTNGGAPPSILAPLTGQPDAFLRRDAAASWNRARADVLAQTGITLTVRGWNRTIAEQERFFFERYEPRATGTGPFGDVRWYKGVRYVRVRGASAAIPGTSNHGWGLAVDVVDYGGVGGFDYPRRVRTFPILARHGWTDTEGRGVIQEPWHLVYDPSRDAQLVSNPIDTGGTVTVPTVPGAPAPITPVQEDDMKVLATDGTSPDVWIGDGVTRRRIATLDTLNTVKYLINNGLISAKSSTVETIADLWSLGHPIDVAEDQTVAAVEAGAARAVAETSAAYHQLAALIGDDGEALATAIIAGLTPVIGEVNGDVVRDAVNGAIAGLTVAHTSTSTLIPAADQT